jgi:hypothetical protein
MTSPLPPGPPAVYLPGPLMVPSESVPQQRGVTSVMSHVSRAGDWTLPRLFRVFAVMGEAVIDLTQVRLAPGTSEIEVRAYMGAVKIIVPHNLRVECDGQPLLGEFRVKRRVKTAPSPEAPLVRVSGVALMSSVEIKIVDPAASGWMGRLRRAVSDDDEEQA